LDPLAAVPELQRLAPVLQIEGSDCLLETLKPAAVPHCSTTDDDFCLSTVMPGGQAAESERRPPGAWENTLAAAPRQD